jgi:ParB family chromosome partitioning protein
MSVRDVEKLVKKYQKEKSEKPKEEAKTDQSMEQMQVIYHDLEEKMKVILGTKVSITSKDMKKGKIEIEYYSPDELDHIMNMFRSIQNV